MNLQLMCIVHTRNVLNRTWFCVENWLSKRTILIIVFVWRLHSRIRTLLLSSCFCHGLIWSHGSIGYQWLEKFVGNRPILSRIIQIGQLCILFPPPADASRDSPWTIKAQYGVVIDVENSGMSCHIRLSWNRLAITFPAVEKLRNFIFTHFWVFCW